MRARAEACARVESFVRVEVAALNLGGVDQADHVLLPARDVCVGRNVHVSKSMSV